MVGLINIALDDFDISTHAGFLPKEFPLRRLNSTFQPWEEIACDVPNLLGMKTFRAKANSLPIISTSRLSSEREWRRAYVILSFLTHSYIWGGSHPAEVSLDRSWVISWLMSIDSTEGTISTVSRRVCASWPSSYRNILCCQLVELHVCPGYGPINC